MQQWGNKQPTNNLRMIIDKQGFRLNVGIILVSQQHNVFIAKRLGQDAWQFPQGGMQLNEEPSQTLFRELHEEVGLCPADVEILGCTQRWLNYRLPKRFIRYQQKPLCIGQKQKWFLLKLLCPDDKIHLETSDTPEFDSWRWVDYWHPITLVVPFKRQVYRQALRELAPLLPNNTSSAIHANQRGSKHA
jgi:putative (di)nucleoside polyphosphate hydrolase